MERINAIGRRKASIARVYLTKGKGNITINDKTHTEYLPVTHIRNRVEEPLKMLELMKDFDITVNVSGGGIKGQAEAIRLGITRALIQINEEYKPTLKAEGLTTRDARVVERKKPGLRKARKKEQYSKR